MSDATQGDEDDPRLDRITPLTPGNAVAAILTVEGSYLLQLRDSKRGIFFPSHWGCFGGGVEQGETLEASLARELEEELTLKVPSEAIRYFTRFDMDLAFAGLAPIWRYFYEIDLEPDVISTLTLKEGCEMRLFSPQAILGCTIDITPYDSFALWFHINRKRLSA
jgi:8-oxo-dGTP pyrophosphatase MutT (NUDIX family)